jgi:hypothetical protein
MSATNIPKIGSIKDFQGKERNFIILSTVCSSTDHNVDGHLGFLRKPKRVNVTISRPRICLVIVGDLDLLANDFYWMKLLQISMERQRKNLSGKPTLPTALYFTIENDWATSSSLI